MKASWYRTCILCSLLSFMLLGAFASAASWSFVPTPYVAYNGTYGHKLHSVIAFSENNVWAVGYSPAPTGPLYARLPLIQHYDGSMWTNMFGAVPGSYDNVQLKAISGSSSNDIWIVGRASNACCFGGEAFIEHWDSNVWSLAPLPSISGVGKNYELENIVALAANDVWAVGSYTVYNPYSQPPKMLALHYDGSSWKQVVLPPIKIKVKKKMQEIGAWLTAVSGTGSNDVWAFGNDASGAVVALHWDGNVWTRSTVPADATPPSYTQPRITSAKAFSANDVVAVGYRAGSNYYSAGAPALLRWNGATWNHITAPRSIDTASIFTSVSGTSSSDVWAVGYGAPAYIVHYDGTSWQHVQGASPSNSNLTSLYGVFARTPTDVWAVGQYQNPDYKKYYTPLWSPLVEHYA